MGNIIISDELKELANNSIIICGTARSGTTLIGNLFHSFSNVEYWYEPMHLVHTLYKASTTNPSWTTDFMFQVKEDLMLKLSGRNLNFNPNDDTYILKVKGQEEIDSRIFKTYLKKELSGKLTSLQLVFKYPEIILKYDDLISLMPNLKFLAMFRHPNGVINSLLNKKIFANPFSLSEANHVFLVNENNTIYNPWWIHYDQINLWNNSTELERTAYYYNYINKHILEKYDKLFLVDYDYMISHPQNVCHYILNKYKLKEGIKTRDIVESINYKTKNTENWLQQLPTALKKETLTTYQNLLEIFHRQLEIKSENKVNVGI